MTDQSTVVDEDGETIKWEDLKSIFDEIDFAHDPQLIVALPLALTKAQLAAVHSRVGSGGVIASIKEDEIEPCSLGDWFGAYDLEKWKWEIPPVKSREIIYFGACYTISVSMICHAIRKGITHLMWLRPAGWERISTFRALASTLLFMVRNSSFQIFIPRFTIRVPRLRNDFFRAIEMNDWACRLHDRFGMERYRERPFLSVQRASKVALNSAAKDSSGHIVFVIGSLGGGGAERQCVNTIKGVRARSDVRITVLCESLDPITGSDFFLDDLRDKGVEVLNLKDRPGIAQRAEMMRSMRHTNWSSTGMPDAVTERLSQYLSDFLRLKPTIVHAWMDHCGTQAALAASLIKVPKIVISTRSLAPVNFPFYQSFFRPIYRILADNPAVMMTNNSVAGAESYAKWLDLPLNTFSIIHNGLDMEIKGRAPDRRRNKLKQQFGIPEDALVMGTISRMTDEKRPMEWLEIAREVAEQIDNVYFLICGWGGSFSEMPFHAKELGIESKTIFASQTHTIQDVFSCMDIFLLTSRVEGLPNVLIEAQALGVPVVLPRIGGAPETLINGVTGRVSEHSDLSGVSELVQEVLRDEKWRQKAEELAPKFVTGRFSNQGMVAETMALYEIKSDESDFIVFRESA